jgi:hypothetical protein
MAELAFLGEKGKKKFLPLHLILTVYFISTTTTPTTTTTTTTDTHTTKNTTEKE